MVQLLGDSGAIASGVVAAVHGGVTAAEGGSTLVELQDGTVGIFIGLSQDLYSAEAGQHVAAAEDDVAAQRDGMDEDAMAFLTSIASAGTLPIVTSRGQYCSIAALSDTTCLARLVPARPEVPPYYDENATSQTQVRCIANSQVQTGFRLVCRRCFACRRLRGDSTDD
jgi:hypothetical protein